MTSNIHQTYQHAHRQAADQTLNSILDVITEGVWDWEVSTGKVTRSPAWYRMLGYDIGSFSEDVFTWENIIHPEDYPKVMQHFEQYLQGKSAKYDIEYRCKHAQGNYLWVADKAKIVECHADGSPARMIGAHHNIDQQKRNQLALEAQNKLLHDGNLSLDKLLTVKIAELTQKNALLDKKLSEVESISNTDVLTLVANRKKFEDELHKEISRAKRYNHNLSLALFDIDHFKEINDQHGHKTGDLILCRISKLVKKNIRNIDLLARWGGDEFIIIFPEQSKQQAHISCEKIRTLIHQNINIKDTAIENNEITCSFGVTQMHKDDNFNTIFQRVDQKLYQAKDSGRNKVKS